LESSTLLFVVLLIASSRSTGSVAVAEIAKIR
jgi:hypothetical protein